MSGIAEQIIVLICCAACALGLILGLKGEFGSDKKSKDDKNDTDSKKDNETKE